MLRLILFAALLYVAWRWLSKMMGPSQPRPTVAASGGAGDPHDVLGVPRGASMDEIKSAYQAKVQQYHPDKVAAMGPEVREVAERRTKEINAAYEVLKRGARA